MPIRRPCHFSLVCVLILTVLLGLGRQPVHAGSTFTVTNTADSGEGSLRQAIELANGNVGADTITFAIEGTDPFSIAPLTPLPAIVDPVVIDATTQPGFAGAPLVELSGRNIPAGTLTPGLKITAGASTIRGLVINGFAGTEYGSAGIELSVAGGNVIEGNYIGTNLAGAVDQGNAGAGVRIESGDGNRIGGTTAAARNVISGNNSSGIRVENGIGQLILGNYIGTNAAGTAPLGNKHGIHLYRGSSRVGGTASGEGNLISGNDYEGLVVDGFSAGNIVQGNFIGTDAAGSNALGNARLASYSFTPAAVTLVNGTRDNLIGGTSPAARNVISGNSFGYGLRISSNGANAASNRIHGNYIGTNASGTAALGNSQGVVMADSYAILGGSGAGEGNLISGNYNSGVDVSFNYWPGAIGNVLEGNLIGTDVSGTSALGNRFGVSIGPGADGTRVGGTTAGAGNVISGNRDDGIQIGYGKNSRVEGNYIGTTRAGGALGNAGPGIDILYSGTSSGNAIGGVTAGAGNTIAYNSTGVAISGGYSYPRQNPIRGNAIYANTGLGIDLGYNGVTANDSGDADTGANDLQNYPLIATAVNDGVNSRVAGTLDGAASATFRVEFFDSTAGDPSGYGEGATYLGFTSVTTDVAGHAAFTFAPASAVPLGHVITATATDAANNTSEFSPAVTVTSPTFVVNSTADTVDASAGDGVCADAAGRCTLRAAIAESNSSAAVETIAFGIPPADPGYDTVTGIWTITVNSVYTARNPLPTITAPVVIDGYTQPGAQANTNGTSLGVNSILKVRVKGIEAPYPSVPYGPTDGLAISAGGSTVRGLIVSHFSGAGIKLTGAGGNRIEGCYLGYGPEGSAGVANQVGLYIQGSDDNVVGGNTPAARNVIAGNNLEIETSRRNLVQGNLVGTDRAGTTGLGGSIYLDGGGDNVVGGTDVAARNVTAKVQVSSGSSGNAVRGNYIGTDVTGTVALRTAAGTAIGGGVTVGGGNNTIGGNLISGNVTAGVNLTSGATGNIVQGNLIGTTAYGISALGNGTGITLYDASSNTIGGTTAAARNVIAASTGDGISLQSHKRYLWDPTPIGANANIVQGNFIGTDASGTVALSNGGHGLAIDTANGGIAANNIVGGNSAGAGNVIAASGKNGVYIGWAGASGNDVQGNIVGLNAAGNAALGNRESGVRIHSASDNVVSGNVISGNQYGARISEESLAEVASGNVLQGNRIGTNAAGTAAIGNRFGGVVAGGRNTVIGGTAAGAGNVISGNAFAGLSLGGTGARVLGNFVGTGADGTSALGNSGHGVLVGSATGASIGGTAAGEGNVIAFNDAAGVYVQGLGANVTVRGNSIFANGSSPSALLGTKPGLGIDLAESSGGALASGVSYNDLLDADTGSNGMQNFPVLAVATLSGGETTIGGALGSKASSAYTLDLYASPVCNGSGYGEGKSYLGATSATTDAAGNLSFSYVVSGSAAPVDFYITATATDAAGNTSEFAKCLLVNARPNAPAGLGQYTSTSQVVPVGGAIDSTTGTVKLGGTASDPNRWQQSSPWLQERVKVEFEIKPVGVAFDGTTGLYRTGPTTSGTALYYTVNGLPRGTFHWRARAVDAGNLASDWVNFGGNAESDVDFQMGVQQPQTISFDQPVSPAAYGSTFVVNPTTSATGLTVAVTAEAGSVCTVAARAGGGYDVTMTSATGACVLTASQTGSADFLPAEDVTRTVAARKATLTVTGQSAGKQYSDPLPNLSAPLSIMGFVNGDTAANLTTSPVCGTSATQFGGPGAYPVTCSGGVDESYDFNYVAGTLTVNPENAEATYTGALFVSTGSATGSTAKVTLAATIGEVPDGYPGDIRNANVTFVNRGNPATVLCIATVGLVSAGDTTIGTATCDWTADIGNDPSIIFTVGVEIGNYYTGSSAETTLVAVSKAVPSNFITGGGYVVLSNAAGLYAGDAGSKANFGFNVKYNKGGTNLQGNVNFIVRRTVDGVLRTYQIKGNAMTSLSVKIPAGAPTPATATFNGKASILDITNPASPVSVDGNATVQVTMTDNGEPGSTDRIGITVWNKAGGLWFASNWDGKRTTEQTLGRGNLVVK